MGNKRIDMAQQDIPEFEDMPPYFVVDSDGAEIRMPRTFWVPLRMAMGSSILILLLGGPSWLAIHNLRTDWSLVSVIPSTLWLMIVALFVYAGMSGPEGGRRAAISILGHFSRDHFVNISGNEYSDRLFRYGFRYFRRPFYFDRVPLSQITLIECNKGQASYHAGRDMDDWHIAVWYRPTPPQKSRYPFGRRPKDDLLILELSGPKDRISAFGGCVANLMITAGLPLVQGEDDCSFVPRNSRDEGSSDRPDSDDA